MQKNFMPSGIRDTWIRIIPGVRNALNTFHRGHAPENRANRIPDAENRLEMLPATSSRIMWNGTPQTGSQLVTDLKATLAMTPEPELQFQPDQDASYDLSAKVLNIIKGSKVTKFGFVGNEQYSEFSKAANAGK